MVHLDHGRIPFDHKFRFEFPNFHMLNGTVFSARPEQSHSIPAWAHFLPRITQQNAKGSGWSDSLKCSKLLHIEKLTRIQNSTLPWYLLDQPRHVRWEKLTNFSGLWERVCKPGELTHQKFGMTSPQFSRKSDPIVFEDNRQSRTGSSCDRPFCIQCSVGSKDLLPSCTCSFSWLKELGLIHTSKNDKWNRKFLEFLNFQKKGQPREGDQKFQNEFPETFQFHSILNRNFWKFWLNGTHPTCMS